MNFAFRNAYREIRNNRSFCIFFIINLSLGLVGFLTVDSFKRSLEDKVSLESKTLLGADLAIRARRELSADDLKIAPILVLKSCSRGFLLDASGPAGRSRLVKNRYRP